MTGTFSKQDLTDVVRHFLGPGDRKAPTLCPACGEGLEIRSIATALGLQLDIACSNCGVGFVWSQPQPVRPWKPIHLHYFRERYAARQDARCPYDDCYITSVHYSEDSIQFICPFCNRRGILPLNLPPSDQPVP